MSSYNEPFLERSLKKVWRWYKFKKKQDPYNRELKRLLEDMGEQTKRYNYDLTKNSLVMDIGGFVGDWSHKMVSMYNPYIYIFEPVKKYFAIIKNQFRNNPKVKTFNMGVSNKEGVSKININRAGSSSFFKKGDDTEKIFLIDIASFFKQNKIKKIDVLKINAEGAEYEILERLIETGLVKSCKNIQVQFHKINKSSVIRREKIINELKKTHSQTYNYLFIYENWKIK